MVQQAYKGDVLQRIAGVGFIISAIVSIAANILAPRPEDRGDVALSVAKLAENPDTAKLAFFGIALGIWFSVMGFAGVYRSIASGAGSAWSRLGFYGVLVSAALMTVFCAVLIGATTAAGNGAAVPASTLVIAANSIFGVAATAFWMALAFVGLGIAVSDVYPKWAGLPLLIIGVVTVVGYGIPSVFLDPSKALDFIFAGLALLTSIWSLVVGLWITRREIRAMQPA
ncbi:MAG: hypothetical protein HY681_13320 [Chloroflexi bacterium]|nr:hypothetical protein [Chloroflexota bacterium]